MISIKVVSRFFPNSWSELSCQLVENSFGEEGRCALKKNKKTQTALYLMDLTCFK